MSVNSIKFWIFFIIVLVLYYGLFRKSCKWQNLSLLFSSYVFYGIVDWRMCAMLLVATAVFYCLGRAIGRNNGSNEKKASRLTVLGVLLGIGILFYFKYLDFFISQFGVFLSSLGLQNNLNSFGILMPLGISFFTFKLISYVIEVHRETVRPSRDPVAFGVFVAFFPTIMSGPIDSPGTFLPQLDKTRTVTFEDLSEGAKRILWGMFLKMCIADRLSGYTGEVLGNYEFQNATSIIFASVLYYIQMYTDFAGYSDMAIGVSRMMSLRITENFNRPVFSQNISEYWRRWHISLTSWITRYIYMPLNVSFRNLGLTGVCLAAIINTVAIGAWHGANWTYILFGFYHGVAIVFILLFEKKRKTLEKRYALKKRMWYGYGRMALTFILVDLGMLLFQAGSVGDFFGTVGMLGSGFGKPASIDLKSVMLGCAFFLLVLLKEYKDEKGKNIHFIHSGNRKISLLSIYLLIMFIVFFSARQEAPFIYFKF